MKSILEAAQFIFGNVVSLFKQEQFWEGTDMLFRELTALRSRSDREKWNVFCHSNFLDHPITSVIHQDPITLHSYTKPRGYPGDAQLLDLIYSPNEPPVGCNRQGAGVWAYTVHASEASAVRERRDMLAKMIDEVSVDNRFPRILSVACGHLRELNLSHAARNGLFVHDGKFRALDQDQLSLTEVERSLGSFGVETIHGSVKTILQGKLDGSAYDFVYAAGLYDYLSEALAARLTSKLFAMLSSRGRLLLANFTPFGFGTGYVQTFMDWHLIYRDAEGLKRLAADIPRNELAAMRAFENSNRHIVYLELIHA